VAFHGLAIPVEHLTGIQQYCASSNFEKVMVGLLIPLDAMFYHDMFQAQLKLWDVPLTIV
jgi:hypothetical protein